MVEIEVINGSILEVSADAIVNPANSLGYMGGGVAGVIKRAGGVDIEKEAILKSPIEIGKAIITTAGKLKFKGVIHSPTVQTPGGESSPENIEKATVASLKCADELGFTSIAIPGMGTGVGGVPKDISARVMINAIKKFQPKNLKKVILVDIDEEMVKEWKKNL